MKKTAAAALCFLLIFLFAACGKSFSETTFYSMDTVMSLRIYPQDEKLIKSLEDRVKTLSEELDCHNGAIYKINENGGGKLGEDAAECILKSLEYSEKTGGALSPALGAVTELWGIGEKNNVPQDGEIKKALAYSSFKNISLSGEDVTLLSGVKLDLGATAKGYASQKLCEMLKQSDVRGAVLNLGGNVYVGGVREDGKPWNVAIRDPLGNENDYLGTLALSDAFVISSGGYERFFEKDGKKYHHIIDPETGRPAESDLLSATVICSDGFAGDALSTALFVMGRDRALEFRRESGESFGLILVGKDMRVTVTDDIYASFTENDVGRYSYEVYKG